MGVPQVQTVEKIVQAAPTFVETIAPAPVSYAAPVMTAPIMQAPIVETFAPSYGMPAPMTTMAAPVLETFAPAPLVGGYGAPLVGGYGAPAVGGFGAPLVGSMSMAAPTTIG